MSDLSLSMTSNSPRVSLVMQDNEVAGLSISECAGDACLQEALASLPIHRLPAIVDTQSWPTVAQFILNQPAPATQAGTGKALFPVTPPDLPALLAEQRLEIIGRFASHNPADRKSAVELTEIIMAKLDDRGIEPLLFTQRSLDAELFCTRYDDTPNEIAHALESFQRSLEDLRRDQEKLGISDGSLAKYEQIAREMDYVIDTWFGDEPEPGLSLG